MNQGDIDGAKGTIDDVDKQIKKHADDPKGQTYKTEEDARRAIVGNLKEFSLGKILLKVEGGFFRIQVGASDTIVYGFKGECVAPLSVAFVLGMDIKTVLGMSQTRIMGAKYDKIGGAKVDNLLGLKHEVTISETKKEGGAPAVQKEGSFSDKMDKLIMKIGAKASKFTNWLYKTEELKARSGAVKKDIKELEDKIKTYEQIGTSYKAQIDKLKQDCSSKAEYDADKIQFTASGWQARGSGSFLNLFPDSQCYVEAGGSGVCCGPSEVRCYGSIHKFGCSF